MHDRPSIPELLEILQSFLDEEIVPATTGRKQFLSRVAANTTRMIARELDAEDAHFQRAWAGLDALTAPEVPPADRVERGNAVTQRLQALCARIREGAFDEGSPVYRDLLAFARERVRDKLEISNPRLLAADAKRGIQ